MNEGTIGKCIHCGELVMLRRWNPARGHWVDDANGRSGRYMGWRYCHKGNGTVPHEGITESQFIQQTLSRYDNDNS